MADVLCDKNDLKALQDHTYVEAGDNKSNKIKLFPCLNCNYVAKRKYTLGKHQEQHCKATIRSDFTRVKDKRCSICLKYFTHDGLRSHLRGYINGSDLNRISRGKHALYSAEQHICYLNAIKLK